MGALSEIVILAISNATEIQEQVQALAASSQGRLDGLAELLRSELAVNGDRTGYIGVIEEGLSRTSEELAEMRQLLDARR